jgi:hypothetical protein
VTVVRRAVVVVTGTVVVVVDSVVVVASVVVVVDSVVEVASARTAVRVGRWPPPKGQPASRIPKTAPQARTSSRLDLVRTPRTYAAATRESRSPWWDSFLSSCASRCETCLPTAGSDTGSVTVPVVVIVFRILAIVERWFYGMFDALSHLLADAPDYPEDRDVLASTPSAPADERALPPDVRRALARVRAS